MTPNDPIRDWVEERSKAIEFTDGWDSLTTMRTIYPTDDDTGAILCVFPRCAFRRHDPLEMFKHVHFGPHGLSYGMTFDQFATDETEVAPDDPQ